ncbi:MAG: hypothetical protein ACUVSL_12035, partial [Chloroflexus sp.]|uniref:hypothetical protein n=1 Tax=Chloroflexus sp. TaxID=1904827 RepID=UPI00404A58C5
STTHNRLHQICAFLQTSLLLIQDRIVLCFTHSLRADGYLWLQQASYLSSQEVIGWLQAVDN